VPGEGERSDVEDDENVGEQFGKTREEAEGERDGWRGIRFQEWECTQGEVMTCDDRRHQCERERLSALLPLLTSMTH
jgi:hypothetical protein